MVQDPTTQDWVSGPWRAMLSVVGDVRRLRVQCSAGVLPERCRHDPLGVDDGDLTTDPVTGVSVRLDPAGQLPHRSVMRVEHRAPDRLVAQRPNTDADFGADAVTSNPRTDLSS